MPRKLSEQEIQNLRSLKGQGLSNKEIKAKTGYSKRTVQKYTADLDKRFLGPEEIKELRRLKKQGKTLGEIMAITGRSDNTILRHTKDIPSPKMTPDPVKEQARELRRQGFMISAIAEKLGLHKSSVQRAVKGILERGVPKKDQELFFKFNEDGLSARRIGEIMGYPPSTVHGYLRGMKKNNQRGSQKFNAKLTEEIVQEVIVPWFKDGVASSEIADRLHRLFDLEVSASLIRKIRKRDLWRHATEGLLFSTRKTKKDRKVS